MVNLMYVHLYRQCEEAMVVLQNDNEQLEREKSELKDRLKQLTKTKLVDDLMQKKAGATQKATAMSSNNLALPSSSFSNFSLI